MFARRLLDDCKPQQLTGTATTPPAPPRPRLTHPCQIHPRSCNRAPRFSYRALRLKRRELVGITPSSGPVKLLVHHLLSNRPLAHIGVGN